jgi:hypothetical protein
VNWASVPKTAIDKDDNAFFSENEVRLSFESLIATPSRYAVLAED